MAGNSHKSKTAAWHCGCDDMLHACDSQCSMITVQSLRGAEGKYKMKLIDVEVETHGI